MDLLKWPIYYGNQAIVLDRFIGILAWHALNFQKVWQFQKVIKLCLTTGLGGTRVIPEMG
jgi:hypothetical protein